MPGAEKTCFVIAPIGGDGSAVRQRSDKLFRHLISPVATQCGYSEVQRADQLNRTGLITSQIMEHLHRCDLVIADLSDHNPNVFYELAVRHCFLKPAIPLIVHDQSIPFDLIQMRTIKYDLADPDAITNCRETIAATIRHLEQDPAGGDTPVSSHASRTMRLLSHGYLLVLELPYPWSNLQVTRLAWKRDECFVRFGANSREPIRVVPSGVGPTFQVLLPDGIFDRISPTDTFEIQLRDMHGNRWEVGPFFPFRKTISATPLEPREKIIRDYGDDGA